MQLKFEFNFKTLSKSQSIICVTLEVVMIEAMKSRICNDLTTMID